ncbi:hypothetical protein PsorP6_018090 [Peronosclerospora sorghi]|uniref:Uncharacterized protein n=1 Tax=Peronosclerospora sorghi TaxID=230839 RepID=A0ACC0WEK3_9STRA|nr:hypothetical protein PsorP6_018090 [Peronosclerospora sorghi]
MWSLGGTVKKDVIEHTLQAQVNLETDAAWQRVSREANALVRGLLTKDPAARFTAHEALAHEWFSTQSIPDCATDDGSESDDRDSFESCVSY